ncbi:MAG: 5-guanidino-2-oxopentanoate decarboxylase [Hyphomicrobiales bacterium]
MAETNAGRSVGQALVALLKDYGVDTVFGIPGVHNNELYRGLLNSGMHHILPRHEQGAGFMADGYARATGKAGVCFTITGPGLTNIMTPLGQAYSDSVPMLVISSVLDVKDMGQGRGRLHEMTNQCAAAATVTGMAATAYAPEDVPELVARAFAGFRAGRPRPAYIEIPIDVLSAEASGAWAPGLAEPKVYPDPAGIAAAARVVAGAERPMMIAGGGAAGAADGLRTLAERLNAIVFPTVAGKGIVSDDHPLSAGALLPRGHGKKLLASADVVLAVGTELSETDFWEERIGINGHLIRIDVDPDKLADRYGGDTVIMGDAAVAVEALLDALPDVSGASRLSAEDVTDLAETVAGQDDDDRGLKRKVLDALRAALPAETIVVTDMTTLAYAGNEMFPVTEPRLWMHPSGFGTLGYALPAAIGAKVGAAGRPVVALAGDYGFQYTLNELGVAAELKQPLIVVLWNSDGLQAIMNDMDRKGIGHIATNPLNPDFEHLTKAYGGRYRRVQSVEAIDGAVREALAAEGLCLIELDAAAMA